MTETLLFQSNGRKQGEKGRFERQTEIFNSSVRKQKEQLDSLKGRANQGLFTTVSI